jgi:hypothetical protein
MWSESLECWSHGSECLLGWFSITLERHCWCTGKLRCLPFQAGPWAKLWRTLIDPMQPMWQLGASFHAYKDGRLLCNNGLWFEQKKCLTAAKEGRLVHDHVSELKYLGLILFLFRFFINVRVPHWGITALVTALFLRHFKIQFGDYVYVPNFSLVLIQCDWILDLPYVTCLHNFPGRQSKWANQGRINLSDSFQRRSFQGTVSEYCGDLRWRLAPDSWDAWPNCSEKTAYWRGPYSHTIPILFPYYSHTIPILFPYYSHEKPGNGGPIIGVPTISIQLMGAYVAYVNIVYRM